MVENSEQIPQPDLSKNEFDDSNSAGKAENNLGVSKEMENDGLKLFDVRQELSKFAIENSDYVSDQLSLVELRYQGTEEMGPDLWESLAAERTWGATIKRIFGGRAKTDLMDYTEKNNYPGAFPYEVSYAGERYWSLIINLLKHHSILSQKGKGQQILEIGCATGGLLVEIDRQWPEAEKTGMDISGASLEFASRQLPQASFLQGDLNKEDVVQALMGEEAKQLDLVIAMDVVEHLKDPAKQDVLLAKIYERLKPGGVLIIGMPELPSARDGWFKRLFKEWWNNPNVDTDTSHYNKPTPERTDEMLSRAGFNLKTDVAEDFGYFPIPAPLGRMIRLGFSANRLVVLRKGQ